MTTTPHDSALLAAWYCLSDMAQRVRDEQSVLSPQTGAFHNGYAEALADAMQAIHKLRDSIASAPVPARSTVIRLTLINDEDEGLSFVDVSDPGLVLEVEERFYPHKDTLAWIRDDEWGGADLPLDDPNWQYDEHGVVYQSRWHKVSRHDR